MREAIFFSVISNVWKFSAKKNPEIITEKRFVSPSPLHRIGGPENPPGRCPLTPRNRIMNMTKLLPLKSARKSRKTTGLPVNSAALQAAIARVANVAGRETLKSEKVQHAAYLAIAETLDAWFDLACEADPDRTQELFFEFGCFARGPNSAVDLSVQSVSVDRCRSTFSRA